MTNENRSTGAIPKFADLPCLPESEERHSWEVWGPEDELGTINFIGPEQVVRASKLVTSGIVISLSYPLDKPAPTLGTTRSPYVHTITKGRHGRDDHLDSLYLQYASQWDGLRHVSYRHHFYGGRQDIDVDENGKLGIEHWAEHGIIGRGVLLDAKQYFEDHGNPLTPNVCHRISPEELDAIAAHEHVEIEPGDIVIVRTGWAEWFVDLDLSERESMVGTIGKQPDPLQCPGIESSREMAAWLWDHQVSTIVSDNYAVEALPVDRATGHFMHYRLIPLLGMPLGELWALGKLSAYCRQSSRYEFFLTSGVLNLPGGVGSPPNAYGVF